MTRSEIIHMARKAGFVLADNATDEAVERFRRLIVLAKEEEREACAKVCDAEGREWDSDDVVTEKNYAAHCAAAIRARGDA